MKGIILAGGTGSRLHPITKGTSKQLLAVYDKPMIYYPLSVLLLAGIKEILIISTPKDLPNFKKLFGDGSDLGISLSFAEQPQPEGLAQSFIIGESFIGNDDVCLILGDNIFYGQGFTTMLNKAKNIVKKEKRAAIFGYYVDDPKRYGVVSFDNKNRPINIEEKPQFPNSNFAVVGLYFYPNSVIELAKSIKPSKRGELEITDINQHYLTSDKLAIQLLSRGFAWLDIGTHESLLEASNFIQAIERRQGLKVACLEEIAFDNGYITRLELISLAQSLGNNGYSQYLLKKINRK